MARGPASPACAFAAPRVVAPPPPPRPTSRPPRPARPRARRSVGAPASRPSAFAAPSVVAPPAHARPTSRQARRAGLAGRAALGHISRRVVGAQLLLPRGVAVRCLEWLGQQDILRDFVHKLRKQVKRRVYEREPLPHSHSPAALLSDESVLPQ